MREKIIGFYRAIEDTSALMVDCALKNDWASVAKYESACAVLISQLRENAEGIVLTSEEKKEKSKIMISILRNDAQIRMIAEPWIGNLDFLLFHKNPNSLH